MVLDYSKICGACSMPLDRPAKIGYSSLCGYLHTEQGRRDFERTLKRNKATKGVVDRASTVTPQPDVLPSQSDGVTIEHGVTRGVTSEDDGVTQDDDGVTDKTRQQRHYRINRERINQERRDRRNSHDGDGVL